MGEKWKQRQIFFSWSSQITVDGDWSHEIKKKKKNLAPLKRSYDKPRQSIKKQRHHFADKGPDSQNYGFSSTHAWMWELDHKEGWVLLNHGSGEDLWQSSGLQRDQTSQS